MSTLDQSFAHNAADQLEQHLRQLAAEFNVTPEQLATTHTIDVYPQELLPPRPGKPKTTVRVQQQYRVRVKTPEELHQTPTT